MQFNLDKKTDLYYLNSRYYDPEIGRFLSADSLDYITVLGFDYINGLNGYVYCLNNPVIYLDDGGKFPKRASKGHQSGNGLSDFYDVKLEDIEKELDSLLNLM